MHVDGYHIISEAEYEEVIKNFLLIVKIDTSEVFDRSKVHNKPLGDVLPPKTKTKRDSREESGGDVV
jgi:hypothetical protein